jgi:hypothetical protein
MIACVASPGRLFAVVDFVWSNTEVIEEHQERYRTCIAVSFRLLDSLGQHFWERCVLDSAVAHRESVDYTYC